MAMTACFVKVSDEFDLLVSERTDLLAIDGDNTDQPIVLEHGDNQNGPRAPELGDRFIRLIHEDVSNVDDLLGPSHATKGRRRRER